MACCGRGTSRTPMKDPDLGAQNEIKQFRSLSYEHLLNDMAEDYDCVEEVEDNRLSKALTYIRKQRSLLKKGNEDIVEEESRFKAWIDDKELTMMLREEFEQLAMKGWLKFDLIVGAVVILNGVLLGLTTENIVDENTQHEGFVELGFVVFFAGEWLIRWWYNKDGVKGMLTNIWTLLDLIILVISVGDIVLGLVLANVKTKGGRLAVIFRVIRLIRLVRLVRLVRLLEELYMLVHSLYESLRYLLWSLLMLVILCYIGGLFMGEIVTNEVRQKAPLFWGTHGKAIISMAQITTYSTVVQVLMPVYESMGPFVLLVPLALILVAGLGIFNLITGVLLITTLKIASRNSAYSTATERLVQHRALRSLREVLTVRCREALHQEKVAWPTITKQVLDQWLIDEEEIDVASHSSLMRYSRSSSVLNPHKSKESRASKSSRVSNAISDMGEIIIKGERTQKGMAGAFQAAKINEDDIEAVFEEAFKVFGDDAPVTVDDFIESCVWMKSEVHPLEVVNFINGLKCARERLTQLDSTVGTALHTLQDTSEHIRRLLMRYHRDPAAGKDVQDGPNPDGVDDDVEETLLVKANLERKMLLLKNREAAVARDAADRQLEATLWTNFDGVFAKVVVVNALVLGFEVFAARYDDGSPEWNSIELFFFATDQCFLTIYTVEMCLRTIFYYQMRVLRDYRDFMGFLPRLLINMKWPQQIAVVKSYTRWLGEYRNLMWLDLFIIFISILDNWILRNIPGSSSSYRQMVQMMGLLRLLRLARLLQLVRPLTFLMRGFLGNAKLILWSCMVLLICLYAGGITVVMMLSQDPAALADQTIMYYWGNIPKAMLTLGEMVTYDDWGDRVDEIVKFAPWFYGFCIVFLSISSLGIFNLITGVMVQAAFQIVTEDNEKGQELQLSFAKAAIEDALAKNFLMTEHKVKMNRTAVKEHILRSREAVKEEFEKFKQQEEEVRRAKEANDTGNLTFLEEESTADVDEFVVKADMRSLYDEANVCTVVHATWCSHGDLAVGFDSVHDETDGPMREAMLSMIIWDSGRSTPAMFLPDTWVGARGNFVEDSDDESFENGQPGWMDKSNEHAAPRVNINLNRGDLLFTDVPRSTRLRFRFGGNYSTVPLFVDCPPCLEEKIGMNLQELSSVDTAVVSIREVETLLQDGTLLQRLRKSGFMPIQVLMVFQTLNVNDDGTVKVNDFIEGLLRMQQTDAVGFDTAGAKSFMRLLLSQCRHLVETADHVNRTYVSSVAALRGVSVVDFEEGCAESRLSAILDEASSEPIIEAQEQVQTRRIEQLTEIISRLNNLVSSRKKVLKVLGTPVVFEEASDEEISLIVEEENRSISSAKTGWD